MQITSSETQQIKSVALVRENQGYRLKICIRVNIPFNHTDGRPFYRRAECTVSFPVRLSNH
jgi:hypothetical protein